jgi:hypothetical protein
MTTYAVFLQDGNSIDYTPASDVQPGDVVVLGSLIGIATRPIPANTTAGPWRSVGFSGSPSSARITSQRARCSTGTTPTSG